MDDAEESILSVLQAPPDIVELQELYSSVLTRPPVIDEWSELH
jgi:hypothetical protein